MKNVHLKAQYSKLMIVGLVVGVAAVAGVFMIDKKLKTTNQPLITNNAPAGIHFHAAFIVVKNDQLINFSGDKYTHFKPCTVNEHEEASSDVKDKVHLHDGIGDIVHVHAENITWEDLFKSIDFKISNKAYGYSDGKKIDNVLNTKIENYSRMMIVDGDDKSMDLNKLYAQVPSVERIKEIEKRSESCGI